MPLPPVLPDNVLLARHIQADEERQRVLMVGRNPDHASHQTSRNYWGELSMDTGCPEWVTGPLATGSE